MISLLKTFWKPLALFVLVASLLCGFAHWRYAAGYSKADMAWQLKWSQRNAADVKAAALREASARAEEQRRQTQVNQVTEDADKQLAAAKANASDAQSAADSLRQHLNQLQRQLAASETGRVSAIAAKRSAEARAGVLLAQLLAESDKATGQYAAEADNARIAGSACERAYTAITGQDDASIKR